MDSGGGIGEGAAEVPVRGHSGRFWWVLVSGVGKEESKEDDDGDFLGRDRDIEDRRWRFEGGGCMAGRVCSHSAKGLYDSALCCDGDVTTCELQSSALVRFFSNVVCD